MRCFNRSTRWAGSVAVAVAIGLLAGWPALAAGRQDPASEESAVRHAVVESVKARMGQDADVRIEALTFQALPAPGDATLTAAPEPGARLARQHRFTLRWVIAGPHGQASQRPAGYALATVFVAVEHARASRAIERGETCEDAAVVSSQGEVGAVLLQRLPRRGDVVGSRALRGVMADEVFCRAAVGVRPAVRSGDVVAVRAVLDGVTVQGRAVAQQSGGEGDVIRAVNPESRRPLKVRVTGPGKVEVLQ